MAGAYCIKKATLNDPNQSCTACDPASRGRQSAHTAEFDEAGIVGLVLVRPTEQATVVKVDPP